MRPTRVALLLLLACLSCSLAGCFPDEPGEGKVLNDVNTDPRITVASLPIGTVGLSYNFTMHGLGGTLPYTWSATGLPANLAIDPDTGTISGTPQTAGVYTVTFHMVDSSLLQVVTSKDYQLYINEPVAVLGG